MGASHPTDSEEGETVIYDFDPHNLPSEVLRAVGLLVAASSQTESVVQELIGAILQTDNIETRALTAQMSALLKDHVARALTELNAPSPQEIDQLDDLLDAVNAAFAKRNVIVHNALMRHPKTGEVFSLREQARGSLKLTLQPIRVEQIEEDAAAIYSAGMDLMSFMISRGISPTVRTRHIYEPLDRSRKARAKRRELGYNDVRPA